MPHCYPIDSLKTAQNRGIRFIHSPYSYNTSLSSLKKSLLFQTLSSAAAFPASLCQFQSFFHSSFSHPHIIPPAHMSHRARHLLQAARSRIRTTPFATSFIWTVVYNDLPPDVTPILCPLAFSDQLSIFCNENSWP